MGLKAVFFMFLSLQVFWQEVQTHEQGCPVVMDLAFLVDGSGSISKNGFTKMKAFVKRVLLHFSISDKGTHVGLVVYDGDASVRIRFTDAQETDSISGTVDSLTYPGGGTNIERGLTVVVASLFDAATGMRNYAQRVLVVTTDGENGGGSLNEISNQLHDSGIHVFALGIGGGVKQAELEIMASRKSHVLNVPSLDAMVEFGSNLASDICSVGRTFQAIIPIWFPNMVLKGSHVIRTQIVQSDITCTHLCLRNPNCFSFNFYPKNKTCELTDSTANSTPHDVVSKHGTSYYELRFL